MDQVLPRPSDRGVLAVKQQQLPIDGGDLTGGLVVTKHEAAAVGIYLKALKLLKDGLQIAFLNPSLAPMRLIVDRVWVGCRRSMRCSSFPGAPARNGQDVERCAVPSSGLIRHGVELLGDRQRTNLGSRLGGWAA